MFFCPVCLFSEEETEGLGGSGAGGGLGGVVRVESDLHERSNYF